MAEFWELPIDPRNVFANWFIGNTDPALDPDNRVLKGKPWVQTTNDSEPWGPVLGLFFRDADNLAWVQLPTGPTGATGATGAAGANGTNGVNGVNGTVIRQGSGAPSNGLGVDGDYYINTANGDLYQKAGGTYGVIENIIGPTGPTGPTGTVVLYDSGALAAPAASIDTGAAGVAGGYRMIEVVVIGRTDETVLTSTCAIRFNNDSGANYNQTHAGWDSGGVSSGSIVGNTGILMPMPGSTFTASSPGMWMYTVPFYADTTFHKVSQHAGNRAGNTAGNNIVYNVTGTWRNTAAITRVAIFAPTGKNFIVGSRMIVYGR